MKKTGEKLITELINGITFYFILSYEINGNHATVVVLIDNNSKSKFSKIDNNTEEYERIATDFINNLEEKSRYQLILNQIQSHDEWVGQFKKE